ncbi:MAG: beta-lactamase family protein [Proteobacteria bacterium]|nr:beta-lactamase family protein [Pseudomonadota bacterium]
MSEPDRRVTLNRRDVLLLTGAALGASALTDPAAATGANRTSGATGGTAVRGAGWAALDAECAGFMAGKFSPGLSICVMRNGRPLYSKGFGSADLQSRAPMTADSVLRIGSITKQFTAAAILLLQQDGRLSIDDRLSRFLPLFPHSGDFTLRQMLTHTSGLGNYTDTSTPEVFLQQARIDYPDPQLIAAMAATSPLMKSTPGTAWSYSNTAYVLLGIVVEIAAQEAYGAYYQRRLFGPAGMHATAVDDAAEVVPDRAAGYTPDAKSASGFANASFISMTYPGGAGSIRSTPQDLCRWHGALLGGRILQAASLMDMTTAVHLQDGSLPRDPDMARVLGEDKPIEYGFGVMMGAFEGQRYVEHGGGINGFLSELRSFPERGVSVSLIMNCDSMGKPEAIKHLYQVRDVAARAALAQA